MALTDKLTAIADAIRVKGGTTDLLTLDGMVDAINAIETGGGGGADPVINPLTITENGTYTAPSGGDGYSPVTVNVSGATDITDSIVSVAFSAINAYAARNGFYGIIPEDAKIAIFLWQGDKSNAVNNQCLFTVLQRVYINSNNLYYGTMMYCRWKNSSYEFQMNNTTAYDLIVNAGDTFRMVVLH